MQTEAGKIRLEVGEIRLTIESAAVHGIPHMPNHPAWLWLSPAEDAILRVLAEIDEPLRAKTISLKLDQGAEPTQETRELLKNLVARKILLLAGEGYSINPA